MFWQIIIALLIHVHLFFLAALVKKNYSLIDIAWGLGPIMVGIISYLNFPLSFHNAVILFVVVIWGLRLSLYIMTRSRGKGEDPRYTKFRNSWGAKANLHAYFKVFLLQGALMFIISLPVSVGMYQGRGFSSLDLSVLNWIGLIFWGLGFGLEVWADFYLFFWKKNPENKNKICTKGPWRICRFPNYFGEVVLWYGIYLLSVRSSSFWTIIGPVVLHFFIVKVTGIAPLEEKYLTRPDYQDYAKKVPRFFPFIRKSR